VLLFFYAWSASFLNLIVFFLYDSFGDLIKKKRILLNSSRSIIYVTIRKDGFYEWVFLFLKQIIVADGIVFSKICITN